MFAKKLSRREMAVWCAALALGCVLAGLSGFALDWGRAQLDTGAALCADTLRLHIKADSDSLLDQTAKLAVRDALLAYTDAQCRASTQPEALHWAAQNLPALELTARQTLARLGLAPAAQSTHHQFLPLRSFATRYQNAALPAGRYDALRITLGENDRSGKNWWCVLYPGLCRAACGSYALPQENDLICGEYIVRFRLVDWVQSVCSDRADRTLLSPAA